MRLFYNFILCNSTANPTNNRDKKTKTTKKKIKWHKKNGQKKLYDTINLIWSQTIDRINVNFQTQHNEYVNKIQLIDITKTNMMIWAKKRTLFEQIDCSNGKGQLNMGQQQFSILLVTICYCWIYTSKYEWYMRQNPIHTDIWVQAHRTHVMPITWEIQCMFRCHTEKCVNYS